MKRYLIIISCLLMPLAAVHARFNFRTFDVRSGMSDNYVHSILRDQYGFMWFATNNGLNRYDGYQYKRYTTTQIGAYNNSVLSLAEDGAGNLWLKTPDFYACYNREKDAIEGDISEQMSQMGITGNISMIYVDSEQNLWCESEHKLYYYIFKEKKGYQISLPDKRLLAVAAHRQRAYLLFEDGEIAQANWQGQTLQKEVAVTLPRTGEHRMYIDSRFRIWIYTLFSPHTQCYDTYKRDFVCLGNAEVLQNEFVKSIIDDGEGNVWIGTNSKGIYILNKENDHLTSIQRYSEDDFSLPNSHINCLYKDDHNIMWIGTTKQGVIFTSLNNKAFEVNRIPEFEDITCFQEDTDGNLWMGLDGKGVVCYNPKRNEYRVYNTTNSTLPSDLIIGTYLDKDGKIWFSSYGNSIFYKEGNGFCRQQVPTDEKTVSATKYVRHFLKDRYGNMWIGTMMNGLYCMDPSGRFSAYNQENTCLRTNSITDLIYSQDQLFLYIATGSGLYKLDILAREITPIVETDRNHVLNKLHINCLYQDGREMLWIGTRNGVHIYNPKNGELTQLTMENALSHSNIKGIVEDKRQNIWLTTDKGITYVAVTATPSGENASYHCYPYFEEDGIGDIIFNNYSVYCTANGEILMGGTGKYLKINPALNVYPNNSRKVVFTGLFLANQRMDVGEETADGRVLLQRNIQLLDAITMEHSDNNFALEVSAMDYAVQHKLQFSYRMGKDEEWVKLEGNKIYFNKLSPGSYQLQVRVNEFHINDGPISTLIIHVRPPFWLSGPAYLFYFLLIVFGCIIVYWRMNRKHKRLMARQKRELEISQQHEMDEAKMRFFTNVGHDLRTPLSLIITPLDKLLRSDNAAPVKRELQLIHRNASVLLDEVNQLLDFRKLDQQKAQLSPVYGDWAHFVLETSASFYELAERDNISLHLPTEAPKIEMDFDRNKMQRILFNLLSNAIKYNHKYGEVTVALARIHTAAGDAAQLQIADTGIGIKNENKERIFDRFFQEKHHSTPYVGSGIGLHIVKEYVALHQGKIEVTDNQPQGSVFTVTFPIRHLSVLPTLTTEEPIVTDEKPSKEKDLSGEGVTLLVVEDNTDFRGFLVGCLKEYYQVYEASNGEEALSVLDNQQIQLVISDVMMPIMDGIELCQRIKGDIRYSHIPVVLLTARVADEHILSGLKEGADEYITKPFNIDILLLRIQKILKWTQYNHEKFKTIDISPAEITVSRLDEQLIEKAIQIVEENMDNSDFSVEEFSFHIGMSRSSLYKKLMQITGKSPLEFMRILRLKRGRSLLEESQLGISQIAYQVGLSPKQFAKFFKEEFGCLPSEYLKKKE